MSHDIIAQTASRVEPAVRRMLWQSALDSAAESIGSRYADPAQVEAMAAERAAWDRYIASFEAMAGENAPDQADASVARLLMLRCAVLCGLEDGPCGAWTPGISEEGSVDSEAGARCGCAESDGMIRYAPCAAHAKICRDADALSALEQSTDWSGSAAIIRQMWRIEHDTPGAAETEAEKTERAACGAWLDAFGAMLAAISDGGPAADACLLMAEEYCAFERCAAMG